MKTILNKRLISPFFFLISGLLFFTIGSGMTYRQRSLEKLGIEAKGVVIGLDESYDSDGQLLHIIFMLVGGVIVAIGAYLTYSTLRDLPLIRQEA